MPKGFFIRERDGDAVLRALDVLRTAILGDDEPARPTVTRPDVLADREAIPTRATPPPAHQATSRRQPVHNSSSDDEARLHAARDIIAHGQRGAGGRYKPQPRSKAPYPRYADFAVVLMGRRGGGPFSTAELETEMRTVVELHENSRKARSALRTALDGDSRFLKVGRGSYRMTESAWRSEGGGMLPHEKAQPRTNDGPASA